MCIAIPEVQRTYRTIMAMRKGTMFVSKTWDAPELIEKHCIAGLTKAVTAC